MIHHFIKKFLFLSFFSIFIACQEHELMTYHKVFEIPLGFETNQMGSNIPILESYPNRQGFTDEYLSDVPKLSVQNNKVYIADTYNKLIKVFPLKLSKSNVPSLIIPNQGDGFTFARPYEVFVDSYDNIYVLGSIKDSESYEVQNYSNQTAEINNYEIFEESIQNIPQNNFYLYKFSSRGTFLYKLGFNGINSDPMSYPNKISGDNFGNIYLSFASEELDIDFYHVFRRYSPTGEFNFEFNTKNISINTNINNTNYQGSIVSIDNFLHDEQLAVLIEYQPTTNQNEEIILPLIDNIWSSVNIYSILENDFTKEILKNESITESILGIDKTGEIFFQSYDPELNALKIRILNPTKNEDLIHYAPIHSSYYVLYDYFIDDTGNLYNYLMDRKSNIIVLNWNTKENNK